VTRFGKTHDLAELLDQLPVLEPAWELLRNAAKALTDYAVRFRYPGAWASRPEARAALNHANLIRDTVRARLDPPIGTKRKCRTNRTAEPRIRK
jgi:hypothetical protein